MSFATDLQRFGTRAKEKQTLALKKCAFELFSNVIMRTPVDTGRLRGNWQATVGNAATGVVDDVAGGPVSRNGSGSSKAKTEMEQVVLGEGSPTVLHLANNLPYAQVVEYGSSKQMPEGMVRVSVAKWQNIVGEVVSALK